jgi:ABC-type transport system substrate-binding protein
MATRAGSHRWVKLGAAALALSLALAACGGSSSSDETKSDGVTDVTIKASGEPKSGGTIKFGLEAESDGFNPTTNRWAVSGYMVGNAVFDPLASYDSSGKWQPYLAKSFTPSADYKTWTIAMRPGVTFSDGTPVDGAAVAKSLTAAAGDALVGIALRNMASATVDPANPLNTIVTTVDPWASLPALLSNQVGFIVAPAQLDAGKPASSNQPIGSGPFVQKEWVPDNRWVGTKNANYWRSDDKGNKLPYLDSVEFRPIVDPQTRVSALISGDINMMHTTDWATINKLQAEATGGNLQFVADRRESEESFVMFNTSKAPVNDPRVRVGLAWCTDRDQVLVVNETPANRAADSQFSPESPYYVNTNFPINDVVKGKELIDAYKADNPGEVKIVLGTTPVPANTATTALLAQQWSRCGVTVEQKTSEQSKFVLDAATGQYEANLWRQFAAADPDGDYQWWTGKNATGALALNFARLNDPQINEALDKARATPDETVRKEAYATVQKRQTELVPYIWLARTQWALGAAKNIRNLTNVSLPDGQPAAPMVAGFGGAVRLTQTWIE